MVAAGQCFGARLHAAERTLRNRTRGSDGARNLCGREYLLVFLALICRDFFFTYLNLQFYCEFFALGVLISPLVCRDRQQSRFASSRFITHCSRQKDGSKDVNVAGKPTSHEHQVTVGARGNQLQMLEGTWSTTTQRDFMRACAACCVKVRKSVRRRQRRQSSALTARFRLTHFLKT